MILTGPRKPPPPPKPGCDDCTHDKGLRRVTSLSMPGVVLAVMGS